MRRLRVGLKRLQALKRRGLPLLPRRTPARLKGALRLAGRQPCMEAPRAMCFAGLPAPGSEVSAARPGIRSWACGKAGPYCHPTCLEWKGGRCLALEREAAASGEHRMHPVWFLLPGMPVLLPRI